MPALALPAFWGAVAAGAAGTAGIVGAKISANANDRAADIGKQSNDEALAFQKSQAAQDQANYEAAQRANYNQYVNKVHAAQALGDTINFHLPDPAPYQPSNVPTGGAQTSSATTSAPANAGSAAALKTLIDQGMDPQQAVAQFNRQYGRTTGNEAVYYDPSQHGGVATIGLPDAYLSLESNGWQITPRAGGGAAPARSIASALPSSSAMSYAPAPVAPFQLRTINAFLR